MSYFLDYVATSLSFRSSETGSQIGNRSRYSISTHPVPGVDEEDDDDDDSALIEHVPLIHGESKEYGTVASGGGGGTHKKMGFTDGYVDWSHSKESITNAFGAFFAYIVVAIIGYSYVFEDWPILDSMYFAVTVFTTVGYGDLAPSTDVSRFFTILFASGGIIILGVFLGVIGARLFELREERVSVKLQGVQKRVMTQFGTEH